MNEDTLEEKLEKIVENQEELQEAMRSIGSPEEGVELPNSPQWLLEEIRE
jgi:uncharacterized protein YjgD (DUF1641 family)